MIKLPSSRILAYKARAALVSLSVFLVFASVLAVLAARCWFPHYLFWTDGGLQGLRLVLMVDFVLGPVLALVFFHPEKSRGKLLFDIAVIAVVQVGAMAWGAWQVREQRPVAVVYGNHRFISVAPDIMRRQQETPESLRRFSSDTPPYIYRREPRDDLEKRRQMLMLMKYGFHPESQAYLFQPFLPNLDKVFEQQGAIRAWVARTAGAAWTDWQQRHGDAAQVRVALYQGRYGNALLIFDADGRYQGYLDLGDGVLPYLDEVPARKGPGEAGGKGGA